jgi:putrescine transport system ATP-binding protein
MADRGGTTRGPKAAELKGDFAPWTEPANPPLVRFECVTKRFGEFAALNQLTLDIYQGEFFALLGPSGCGKTTLLRILAGFERASHGRVLLGGEDLAGVPPYRRPVNMMFQSYALFPHLTVEGNIAFGLKQDGLRKSVIADRVAEMLKLVKLENFAHKRPDQLSGGQRQRVALARSLAKRPKVLLLDEPLAALDKKLRAETQFELMDLQASLGTTFVIVTHDQDEAMTVADRVAVMQSGHIVQVATPAEIYEQPNSRYVADFVGDVNLIEGRLVNSAGGRSVVETAAGATLVIAQAVDADSDSTVWVAVRPEKLRLSILPPSTADHNCLAGTVWDIGYLGNISMYKIRLDDGSMIKVEVANMTRFVERPIGWNRRVWLSFPSEAGIVLTR